MSTRRTKKWEADYQRKLLRAVARQEITASEAVWDMMAFLGEATDRADAARQCGLPASVCDRIRAAESGQRHGPASLRCTAGV